MIEAIETQPWAALAAVGFLLLATLAFWSVMRTGAKRERNDRLEIRPSSPTENARVEGGEQDSH